MKCLLETQAFNQFVELDRDTKTGEIKADSKIGWFRQCQKFL